MLGSAKPNPNQCAEWQRRAIGMPSGFYTLGIEPMMPQACIILVISLMTHVHDKDGNHGKELSLAIRSN